LFWELNARVKDVRFRSKQIIQSSMRILRFIFVVNSDRMRFLLSLMKKKTKRWVESAPILLNHFLI